MVAASRSATVETRRGSERATKKLGELFSLAPYKRCRVLQRDLLETRSQPHHAVPHRTVTDAEPPRDLALRHPPTHPREYQFLLIAQPLFDHARESFERRRAERTIPVVTSARSNGRFRNGRWYGCLRWRSIGRCRVSFLG